MRAGDLLRQAKDALSHGLWLPWLRENCPAISVRVAQRYMRLAEKREEIDAIRNASPETHLGINEALALLGALLASR